MRKLLEHPPRALAPTKSLLLLIDFQAKLMPSIAEGRTAVANAVRLAEVARLLQVPVVATEQNPGGLGPNVAEIKALSSATFHKMHFDATREPAFADLLPVGSSSVVVAGCETHVCVMQTVLGLLAQGRHVHLVRDAVGSRAVSNREAAIARMASHGVDIVTTEMVIFDWLGSSDHPSFKQVLKFVK